MLRTGQSLGPASTLASRPDPGGAPLTGALASRRTGLTGPNVSDIAAEGGDLDAAVNNAGYAMRGPIEMLSGDEMERCLDRNVVGILLVIRAVVPIMRHQESGTIVNIKSLSGVVGIPYEVFNSATKQAVEALSDALRFELAPSNIGVMLIESGSFESGFVGNAVETTAFGSDHVLRDEYERFWEAADRFIGRSRRDPQQVVDGISPVVLDPETSYRQLMGDDVVYVYEAKHAAGLDDTAPLLRARLGLELAWRWTSPVGGDAAHQRLAAMLRRRLTASKWN